MFPPESPPSVIVVGGGVSGLLIARRLAGAGAQVTLLEAGPRLGGQIHTLDLAGMKVDVGAESVHLGAPAVRALVEELGLESDVEASRPGASWLWTGKRRRLPAGVGPTGPTRITPVLTSGILGPTALVRAGLEPFMAWRGGAMKLSDGHDISVGQFVRGRFGDAVADAFVDPLLGSLHSGDIDTLSLRACAPGLIGPASAGKPLLKLRRPTRQKPAAPVMFASWPTGLATLTDAILDGVGVDVHLNTPVTALHPREAGGAGDADARYTARTAGGDQFSADVVVLCTPAAVAADLVNADAPSAAATLRRTEVAHTATIVLGFRREEVAHLPALEGNGFLVPSTYGTLLKAGTHLSRKWPHLDDGVTTLYRLSAGRYGSSLLGTLDDDALLDHVRRDLRTFTGIEAAPLFAHVHRWDSGLPQLTVGHPDRIASARTDLSSALPGVELAGASYDGLGIGACVAGAEKAANRLLDTLTA